MSRKVQYRSVTLEVAAGVVDRKISLSHNVLEFTVPATTLNASVRFGDPGAEAVALQPGGKTKFCFPVDPPSAVYVTSPGGDPITVFGSQEVEPTWSPFSGAGAGVRSDIVQTWPEHHRTADGAAVVTANGFSTDGRGASTFFGARLGGASDDMQQFNGRLVYEGRPTNINECKREFGLSMPIHIPLTDLLAVDQEQNEFQRVFWDTLWLQALGVPDLDLRTGIRYAFYTDPGGGWFNDINLRGWGLCVQDDGGGNPEWHYAANRVNAGPTPDENLNLNISGAPLTRFDILHLAPTATRRARLLVYANGTLRVEREWQAGAGALPNYEGIAGCITRWIQGGLTALGGTIRMGGVVLRRGQQQFDGSLA